ncbi:flavodoxin [Treponema sp. TIM-1]|uniref:flavodoxin family protein n=1 Tax=Treponema sp. TIM-1 TaxID=2898417 RepID=UPI0039802DBF
MKTAVIYYSYEGNCALIAGLIKDALGSDLIELQTTEDKKPQGFSKYLWGGSQVLMKKTPSLKPYTIDPEAYDLIIIGTPVWAASPSPALNTFLGEQRIRNKKIALFCCHAGGRGKVFDKIKAKLPDNTFVGEIDFINPKKQQRQGVIDKLNEWIKGL